jgi:hypothetical protein
VTRVGPGDRPVVGSAVPAGVAAGTAPSEKENPGPGRSASPDTARAPELAPTKAAVAYDPSASALAARLALQDAEVERAKKGAIPVDAALYRAITGIGVDAPEAARLDAKVKAVAERIGLEHPAAFVAEASFAGYSYGYVMLGEYQAWNHKAGQPLAVGVGLKAQTPEDIELLYRFVAPTPPGLRPFLEDFLKLDEEQRIEAILVHEHLELKAVRWGARSPHHTAVADAPDTDLAISPRVRRHLELYARVNREVFGAVGR